MAMGLFEMGDLAGNDVGWRLRQGLNLVGRFGIISVITHCDDYDDGWIVIVAFVSAGFTTSY
jgi:hypothetical protein